MKRLALALVVCLLTLGGSAWARSQQSGLCSKGGQTVTVPGLGQSVTKFVQTYPGCTITVYLTGTSTLATLYSDNSGTPKSNPFTADATTSYWAFYADNATYDVQASGTGVASPFVIGTYTLVDITASIPSLIINGNTITAAAGSATITIPNQTDTLVNLAGTQALTNKTLTSPTVTGATITGGTINNTPIGGVTPTTGVFTAIGGQKWATSQSTLGTLLAAGGDVFAPAASYVRTSDLALTSNTSLLCSGWNSKITMPSVSGTHSIFNVSNVDNTMLFGCQLDGTGMTATGANSFTALFLNTTNGYVAGNWIHDSPEDDIRLGDTNAGINTADQMRIIGNLLGPAGSVGPSGSGIGATSVSNSTMVGNVIMSPQLNGIDIEPDTAGTPPSGALGTQLAIGNNVVNCGGTNANGLALIKQTSGTGTRVTVNGNVAHDCAGSYGLYAANWTGTTFSGNIAASSLVGFLSSNSTKLTSVGGNYIGNTTGIQHDGASDSKNMHIGEFVDGSTTGITETNSAGANFYLVGFGTNTANWGTMSATSAAIYPTFTGGLVTITPGQSVGWAIRSDFTTTPRYFQFLPNAGVGNINPIVLANDYVLGTGLVGTNDSGALDITVQSSTSKGLRFDWAGNTLTLKTLALTTDKQVTSTLAGGTAPFAVTSTTPVAHLTTVPATYNHSGTQQLEAHLVDDACTLGTDCAVTLAGSAAYSSSGSYSCVCSDITTAAACQVAYTSGSQFTITGTGTDVIRYVCVGN